MILVFIISVGLGLLYFLFLVFLINKWKYYPDLVIDDNYTPAIKLSIIIPVRNEQENIQSCLKSILSNNFSKKLYEIIVVDDHSLDNTVDIVKALNDENVRIISLSDNKVRGKKEALKKGISKSHADYIIQTDGDVVVPKDWIKHYSFLFEKKGSNLITAPVKYVNAENSLERFQALELTGLMVFTGVGISTGIYYLANGANMAFKKSIYQSLEKIRTDAQIASGDDVFLIQELSRQNPELCQFAKSKEITVNTLGESNFSDFKNQRIRWSSKTTSYNDLTLKWILGAMFLFVLSILTNFILGLVLNPVFIVIAILQISIKLVIDFIYLKIASAYFDQRGLMKRFILSFAIQFVYMIYIGVAGLFTSSYSWKGRITK